MTGAGPLDHFDHLLAVIKLESERAHIAPQVHQSCRVANNLDARDQHAAPHLAIPNSGVSVASILANYIGDVVGRYSKRIRHLRRVVNSHLGNPPGFSLSRERQDCDGKMSQSKLRFAHNSTVQIRTSSHEGCSVPELSTHSNTFAHFQSSDESFSTHCAIPTHALAGSCASDTAAAADPPGAAASPLTLIECAVCGETIVSSDGPVCIPCRMLGDDADPGPCGFDFEAEISALEAQWKRDGICIKAATFAVSVINESVSKSSA